MLQQILTEMYIDPDVLDALNEEQKKTLFLKMRQEQVRRWKEREEKLEREEPRKPKLRPAQSKSVSWLLGCDGDVQVNVIGEMDEFKSSKILRSGFGERNAASLRNNSHQEASLKSNLANRPVTEPVRSGRENLPPKTLSGVQLNLRENSEVVRTLPPPQVSTCEVTPASPVESVKDTEEEDDTDEPDNETLSLSTICYRPHLMSASVLHSLAPRDTQQQTSPLSITSRLHTAEASEPQISRGKDIRVMSASKRTEFGVGGENRVGRGRVAELMKTFSVSSDSTCSQPTPRSNKPPVPNKPSHLQHLPSHSFR
ncbi:SH2 domain-containing protein 4A isoform X2 [Tachysurus fulvidraco]|uniref:SH2 domain-containing protein 4A isoform X2 n=1 Tax=Tachysurus fulvidraco TaxID=1234273 RepID=UPI001FED835E|nr:SH2 domain-containing protein 4A isoform X2 [Tachysurus fulvidraco]